MKPSLFIGSSSEAVKKGIMDMFIEQLHDFCQPNAWNVVFKINDVTIDALIRESKKSDFALFIFAKDDDIESRGKLSKITRDNVILEAGIFIGELGRERVFLLMEKEVKMPTDLLGITLGEFDCSSSESVFQASVRSEVKKISEKIEEIKTRNKYSEWGLPEISIFGLEPVILAEYERVKGNYRNIQKFSENKSVIKEPLNFNSNIFCIKAYVGGLAGVKRKYLTTTSLNSAFWTQRNVADVMAANAEMSKTIKENKGVIKRLFILDKPLDDHIQLLTDQIVSLRRKDLSEEINRIRDELRQLGSSIQSQIEDGVRVKFLYDSNSQHIKLPAEMNYNPGDAEIAIYDDYRMDIFTSGTKGEIIEVKSYTELTKNFNLYHSEAEKYFNTLWDNSSEIKEAIDKIQKAVRRALVKIDYKPHWLSYYEQDSDESDRDLKILEKGRVIEWLKASGLWGKALSLLDVGTCTGRYLIELSDAIVPQGEITGIDDDQDCVDFSTNKLKRLDPADSRVNIYRQDFIASQLTSEVEKTKPFSIITCMLGTISHFNNENTNELNLAMERFSQLIDSNGNIFIGSWSDGAVTSGNFLSIYSDIDKKYLAKCTPNKKEILKYVSKHGLKIVDEALISGRIDLYHIKKS